MHVADSPRSTGAIFTTHLMCTLATKPAMSNHDTSQEKWTRERPFLKVYHMQIYFLSTDISFLVDTSIDRSLAVFLCSAVLLLLRTVTQMAY